MKHPPSTHQGVEEVFDQLRGSLSFSKVKDQNTFQPHQKFLQITQRFSIHRWIMADI